MLQYIVLHYVALQCVAVCCCSSVAVCCCRRCQVAWPGVWITCDSSDVILVSDNMYVCRVLCYIYVLYMCRMIYVSCYIYVIYMCRMKDMGVGWNMYVCLNVIDVCRMLFMCVGCYRCVSDIMHMCRRW